MPKTKSKPRTLKTATSGAYINNLRAYVNTIYSGRLGRLDYWVGLIIVALASGLLSSVLRVGALVAPVTLLAVFFQLAIAVRRFHDLNKSGWYVLLGLIPLVNFFVWVYIAFFPGNKGGNAFGPAPKDAKRLERIFGLTL